MNSLDHQMGADFRNVWRRVREDNNVRAVVLRAAGTHAFGTGADVKKGGWSRASIGPFDQEDPGEALGPKQNKVWKPVISAVHGLCCGGSFYWLNESDIVICSEDDQFFDPHTTFGMVCAVDGIVNAEGVACIGPLAETSLADWSRVLAINLTGPFLICREALLWLRRADTATIVNIASGLRLLPSGTGWIAE